MDRQRLEMVADVLMQVGDENFSMAEWFAAPQDSNLTWRSNGGALYTALLEEDDPNHCGTTACIAGYTLAIFELPVMDTVYWTAKRALDLTEGQADRLFYYDGARTIWARQANRFGWARNEFGGVLSDQIKAHQAARVLYEIADGSLEL